MYRASVERALSNIALARLVQVPIPTNPNNVLNNLPLVIHEKVRNLLRKRSANDCRRITQPIRVAAVSGSGQAFGLGTKGGKVLLKNPQQLNWKQRQSNYKGIRTRSSRASIVVALVVTKAERRLCFSLSVRYQIFKPTIKRATHATTTSQAWKRNQVLEVGIASATRRQRMIRGLHTWDSG